MFFQFYLHFLFFYLPTLTIVIITDNKYLKKLRKERMNKWNKQINKSFFILTEFQSFHF